MDNFLADFDAVATARARAPDCPEASLGGVSDNAIDLLVGHLEERAEAPKWYWWDALVAPGSTEGPSIRRLKGFFPIYRISLRALRLVDTLHAAGWSGNFEVLIPTVLGQAGMTKLDLNSLETFYAAGPQEIPRGSAAARPSTLRWRPEVTLLEFLQRFREDTIYHPVKQEWAYDRNGKVVFRQGGLPSLRLAFCEISDGAEDR